jgi:hypothetical protein
MVVFEPPSNAQVIGGSHSGGWQRRLFGAYSPRRISVPEFIQEIQKEWPIISGAPWSFLIAVAASGVLIWLFLWIIHRSEITGKNSTIEALKAQLESQVSGLKEQIAAVEQRLKLAADALAASDRAKDELDKQFQAYKSEVAAKGRNASPEKVDAAIVKVASGNTDVRSSLSAAIRDLDGLGALRKLNPEELKLLQDLGKPFGRGMIKP